MDRHLPHDTTRNARFFIGVVNAAKMEILNAGQHADGQTYLRLGDPPSPVPEPFALLLDELAACRHNGTPANHASPWLFPGRHAGQAVAYRSMLIQLRDLGLPMRTARVSALRQLVLQAPAPVIADALGFHYTTTHRQHTNAAGTWSRYAAGDHTPPFHQD